MVQFWLPLVQSQKAIAVIRAADLETGIAMAKAVAAGGMKLIEITWNSAEPVKLLYALHAELPDCWIGAGTLLDLDQLQAAIAAGADFCSRPTRA